MGMTSLRIQKESHLGFQNLHTRSVYCSSFQLATIYAHRIFDSILPAPCVIPQH